LQATIHQRDCPIQHLHLLQHLLEHVHRPLAPSGLRLVMQYSTLADRRLAADTLDCFTCFALLLKNEAWSYRHALLLYMLRVTALAAPCQAVSRQRTQALKVLVAGS
jgi:hypothetical protein